MCSLDRLIDLAKRTGDRLIVHDPIEGRDVVILDVDEYERLVLGKKDVRSLSSGQLLDQINRDIASWRANKEMDEQWEREEMLEDELRENELDRIFGDDYNDDWRNQPKDWRSAGSVLEDRYGERFGNEWDEDVEDNEDEEIKIDDIPDFSPLDNPLINTQCNPSAYAQGKEEPKNIPYQNFLGETEWKEEPLLEEEPVFYEEPV